MSTSEPAASLAGASLKTVQETQAKPQRIVAFAPTVHRVGHAASALPRRRRPHKVYGIKLSEAGMRSWNSQHLDPPPANLTGKALEYWWIQRECLLASVMPMMCLASFDIPMVNNHHITVVKDGGDESYIVPLADPCGSRRHREPPSAEVVAGVAKFMHQEGDVPGWYRLVRI